MKILQRLGSSSKWQVGTVGLAWILFQPLLIKVGITEEQFEQVTLMLFGILGAQAVTDFGKEGKEVKAGE